MCVLDEGLFLFVLEGGPPSVDWTQVKGSQRVLASVWSILSGRKKNPY